MTDHKPLRADARRNRDALVTGARLAFDRGDANLRFDDFAVLAGVGVGTLYRHFPTREALAAAVYQGEVEAMCRRARALAAERSAGEALATFLLDFVEYVIAQPALARTLTALIGDRDDVRADRSETLERMIGELMVAATSDGSIRADVNIGAVMIVLHGIGSAAGRDDWPAASKDAVTLLVDGLKASGAVSDGTCSA